jgi:hypothetical protein
MFRTWLTCVIIGAVAALVLVAGFDALRSSDGETAASPVPATMTGPTSGIFSTTLSSSPPGSQIAMGFTSVWNVPYGFRGSKPERLREGRVYSISMVMSHSSSRGP